MVFGSSKTDTSQTKQIAELQKQVNELVAAFNALSKNSDQWFTYMNKTHFPKMNALINQVNALAKQVGEGEKLDAKQQAALDGLVQTALAIQQATSTETQKRE